MRADSSGEFLPLMSAERDELRQMDTSASSIQSRRNIAIFVVLVLGSLSGILAISQSSRTFDSLSMATSLSVFSAMGSIIFGGKNTQPTALDEAPTAPAPAPAQQTSTVPAECGRSGYPSDDGRIRLYTKAECDDLGGNWYSNGECLKTTGGSFSWDCRELNNLPTDFPNAKPVAAPAPTPTPTQQASTVPAECGRSGYPSDDSRIRLYTKAECDDLGGNWYSNGECLKTTGGSFSWDCRELNNLPTDFPNAKPVAAPATQAPTEEPENIDMQPDDIVNPIPLPGPPVYMPQRLIDNHGTLGLPIACFDMSRDSKLSSFADGHYVVAAVNGKGMYFSYDSGNTWTTYDNSAGVSDWLAVTINMDGEKLSAIRKGTDGSDNRIITSKDFGVTWKISKLAGSMEYTHLVANFEGSILYATVNGENGDPVTIRYSYNQGSKWFTTSTFPADPVRWVSLATDFFGQMVYAATEQSAEGGMIFVSSDKGKTFKIIIPLEFKHWHSIYTQNWGSRVFFTTTEDLNIWFSKDGGQTASVVGQLPYIKASLCFSFQQYGGGYIYAVKQGEYMYKSFDMGLSFHKDDLSGVANWDKCLMTSNGDFDLVSSDVGFYTDKAASYEMTPEQVGQPFRLAKNGDVNELPLTFVSLSQNGDHLVVAYGDQPLNGSGVFMSDNSGSEYTNVSLSLYQFDSKCSSVNDDGSILAVVGWSVNIDRNLFISYDGGLSFASSEDTIGAQYLSTSSDLRYIYATQVIAETPTIIVSHDYGRSFKLVIVNVTKFYEFTSIASSTDGKYVYASSFDTHGNGYIYYSHNHGITWTEIPQQPEGVHIATPTPKPFLPTADWGDIVTSGDGRIVFALKYESSMIYVSNDFGLTWVRRATAPQIFPSVCLNHDGSKIVATGEYVYTSLDGGLSWGADTVSGVGGWMVCTMDRDGVNMAITRVATPGVDPLTVGVYVNKVFAPTASPTMQPTKEPVPQPSKFPTLEPIARPTREPTLEPTGNPVFQPTAEPTKRPLAPTFEPTFRPSYAPSFAPSFEPTYAPTVRPSAEPTLEPSKRPNAPPTLEPTREPSFNPTPRPSALSTVEPSPEPSLMPTPEPTVEPTLIPTMEPTPEPTMTPTYEPTVRPTKKPSAKPTVYHDPTPEPSLNPTIEPTRHPITNEPTRHPLSDPTLEPTKHPVSQPTAEPFSPGEPTQLPSKHPIVEPTFEPTKRPHTAPTFEPTREPTTGPSSVPVTSPTHEPTSTPEPSTEPTTKPSAEPSNEPSTDPTFEPTQNPTHHPVAVPTLEPTHHPVVSPTREPFTPNEPTREPTKHPQALPTFEPSHHPTKEPSKEPVTEPTLSPTPEPGDPTADPTKEPSHKPVAEPTLSPTPEPVDPTAEPTNEPDSSRPPEPHAEPTLSPTPKLGDPTAEPTLSPTPEPGDPTAEPSKEPSPNEPYSPRPPEPVAKPTLSPTPEPGDPTAEPTAEPSYSTLIPHDDYQNPDLTPPEPLPIPCAQDNGNSTFCPGLLPGTVAKVHLRPGCVLFSVNDLTKVGSKPKYQESAILIGCASSSSGVVQVGGDILSQFDMIFEGAPLMSSIIFGPDTQVTLYSGENFDGKKVLVREPSKSTMISLPVTKYGKGLPSANDNVGSLEIVSTSAELNKCEDAMQVYYFKEYYKQMAKEKKRLRIR